MNGILELHENRVDDSVPSRVPQIRISNNYNYRINETLEFYGRSYQINGRGKDQSRSNKSTHFAQSHRCRRAIECRKRS